jgi:hypothetical protein
MKQCRRAVLWLVPLSLAAHPCEPCHTKEVTAYQRSAMSRSLRRSTSEPTGAFSSGGARYTIRTAAGTTFQRIERAGAASEQRVAYAIGSGSHATGYLIEIDRHLFQSPLCYYSGRREYGLAPGYEQLSSPDFTRPVSEECLLCHSGRPLAVPGTANQYAPGVFAEEAISCVRCHGPSEEHLKRPVPGSIVNPAKLPPAARDSICEQCHLAGVTRIPNPGKSFADFHPGQPLEETFTVYVRAGARPFKVISHAEQLARSACARNSAGKLWCGTCHDPHPPSAATHLTYSARCDSCHRGKLPQSHPAGADCIACHMTTRQAQDGGHTVFTDHRIRRRPEPDDPPASDDEELIAWREPAPVLQARNFALATANAGIAARSPSQIVRGYRMLTEAQRTAPGDLAVLQSIGRVLLLGKKPEESLRAFERVLELSPSSATAEMDVGLAHLESNNLEKAAAHLERALALDPLLLDAATSLRAVYLRQGDAEKAAALSVRLQRLAPSLQ